VGLEQISLDNEGYTMGMPCRTISYRRVTGGTFCSRSVRDQSRLKARAGTYPFRIAKARLHVSMEPWSRSGKACSMI